MSEAHPHINAYGKFQSDKYPDCPAGKVPLSTKDPMAQDLLWEYAQRRREVDEQFSDDLKLTLQTSGFAGPRSPEAGFWPLRPTTKDFAVVMEYMLLANDYKGGWEQVDLGQLLDGLWHTVRVLEHLALKRPEHGLSATLRRGAADVANRAMMVVDRLGALEHEPRLNGATKVQEATN